jgi:hypothetical protein
VCWVVFLIVISCGNGGVGYDADSVATATRSGYVGKSVHSKSPSGVGLGSDPSITFTHAASVTVKGGESDVSCSQLSPDGTWLAYATVSHLRLFQIVTDDSGSMKVSAQLCQGFVCVWLCQLLMAYFPLCSL